MKKNKLQKKATGPVEFLAVYVCLFLFFMGILDISLFFRQIYLVQTVSDEALARLEVEHVCGNNDSTKKILREVIKNYYGDTPEFTGIYRDGIYKFTEDKYSFQLICTTSTVSDSLAFSYKYTGLFFYQKEREIFSNFSSNTSFY